MLDAVVSFAVRNRAAVATCAALVLVAGALAAWTTPVDAIH